MIQLKENIREYIYKESERYYLTYFGVVRPLNDIIDELAVRADIELGMSQDDILDVFYREYVDRKKLGEISFDWVFKVWKDVLRRSLYRNKKETIDEEFHNRSLKVRIIKPRTFAFNPSGPVLNRIFKIDNLDQTIVPENIEDRLEETCKEHYPITINHLVTQLREEDRYFWEEMDIYTHKAAQAVSQWILYNTPSKKGYIKDFSTDIWMKTQTQLRDSICIKMKSFEDATELMNHILAFNKNNARNEIKKKKTLKNKYDSEFDLDEYLQEEKADNAYQKHYQELNMKNVDEAHIGLIDIIVNKREGIYEKLTEGITDKVVLMEEFILLDKSYPDLIKKRDGDNLSPSEHKKRYDIYKSEIHRAKKKLLENFHKYFNIPKKQEL